jgi:hypothetical protein
MPFGVWRDSRNISRSDVACYVSAGNIPNEGERDVASNVSTVVIYWIWITLAGALALISSVRFATFLANS